MTDSRIEDAALALGVDLLPWQRELGQRILDGERVMVVRGRRAGWVTLARVIDRARRPDPLVIVSDVFHHDSVTTGEQHG